MNAFWVAQQPTAQPLFAALTATNHRIPPFSSLYFFSSRDCRNCRDDYLDTKKPREIPGI